MSEEESLFKILTKAFTLIELLIVMAVLGVLAASVLTFINPVEQLSRARDTGRINGVSLLGRSVRNYFTNFGEVYPDPTQWGMILETNQEIGGIPAGIAYFSANSVTHCLANAIPDSQPTFCYKVDTSGNGYGAIVYAKLESNKYTQHCSLIGDAYFVFSTEEGKAGMICEASEPDPWQPGTQVYVDF